ncbi:MAG: hypothetical protein WCD69_23980 [Xanthobacteraceae bacterium]
MHMTFVRRHYAPRQLDNNTYEAAVILGASKKFAGRHPRHGAMFPALCLVFENICPSLFASQAIFARPTNQNKYTSPFEGRYRIGIDYGEAIPNQGHGRDNTYPEKSISQPLRHDLSAPKAGRISRLCNFRNSSSNFATRQFVNYEKRNRPRRSVNFSCQKSQLRVQTAKPPGVRHRSNVRQSC